MGQPPNTTTYAPGTLSDNFVSVSDKLPGVYASQTTIDNLGPVERQLLGNAPVRLVLSPADVLVKDGRGAVDRAATGQKLTSILKAYYPDYVLNAANKNQMIDVFVEMETRPQAMNNPMDGHVCMVQLNSGGPKTGSQQMTGLPDSFIRPEQLQLMNRINGDFTLAHELGHCKDGKGGPQQHAQIFFLEQTLTRETSADRQSMEQLAALDEKQFPDKTAAPQTIIDQRAISGMLRSNDDYTAGGVTLHVNDHATVGLLMRPDANPMTALLAPALANRSIDRLLGRLEYENAMPHSSEAYKLLQQYKRTAPEVYDGIIEDHGAQYAEKNPLAHYAAAKALLEEGSFAKDSLAYLNVKQYVDAMERTVTPELLAHEQDDITRFRAALAAAPPAEKERLAVTVAKEAAVTKEVLNDPDNRTPGGAAPTVTPLPKT